ncbi:MAG: ABC transporter ATP-binding protein, partial [Spirochaetes bacterium]|nr:ABC transporter ATP-binding protein [Spirochaetota bacterium]
KVAISEPEKRVNDYPFQLSGGMLQRTMIAQSLINSPALLLADEPTTALDVTIQAQILKLLKEKSQDSNMAIIFVTHDLELIDGFADRVMIMYAGRILELTTIDRIYSQPLHPYTHDLLAAIPRLGFFKDEKRLYSISGNVPEPHNLPSGCKYHPRCQRCMPKCKETEPPLIEINNDHQVRCWLHIKDKENRDHEKMET